MPQAELPPADSPNLVLVSGTDHEKVKCRETNGVEWAGRLTMEQYKEREAVVEARTLVHTGCTAWILTDKNLPPDERPIYASCETTARPAWVAHKGVVEETRSHAVGTVFCPAKYRGKGYASRMLTELGKILETYQNEHTVYKHGVFSTLWSDIGKKFYTKLGWEPYPSAHYALDPLGADEYVQLLHGTTGFDVGAITDLTREDVKETMCSPDALEKTRNTLLEASKASDNAQVALKPTYEQLAYSWTREEYTCEQLVTGKATAFPSAKGAAVKDANVYMAWALAYYAKQEEDTLYILHIQHDQNPKDEQATVKALAACLIRAQAEAKEWNMHAVKVWNASPLTEKAVKLIDPNRQIVHRENDHVSSLRWYGKDLGLGEKPDWWWIERYAWF
ncbi:hypothetical protein KEM55_003596 [Ascosphaera atra]|nr:hypothetical protein KEM55_003596 [Ascosphaera atra]